MDRSHSRSFRVSRSSDRGTRKDRRARSRSDSSLDCGHRSRSRSAYRSWLSGRERRRRSSSRSLSYHERSLSDRSRSSDRSCSRHVRSRSRGDRSRFSDHYRSRRQRSCSPARRGGRRDRSRSSNLPRRSRGRSPSFDHLRSKERGRQARREQQEGVETVKVSQAPAVSEVPAAVVPPAGGAAMATLPSAVQVLFELCRILFPGSGVAGAAASASGVGVQLCPYAPGGEAVASCTVTAVPAGLGWSSFCFRCCARLVQPSAASGDLTTQQASPSLIQRWDRQSAKEASEGSVSFPWSFFSLPGEALSVILRVFGGCPSRGLSSQSWTCTWRYSWRFSPRSGR